MKNTDRTITPAGMTGRLGSARAEKIAALEGLTLTARMRSILDDTARRGLSGDERRAIFKALFVDRKPAVLPNDKDAWTCRYLSRLNNGQSPAGVPDGSCAA